MEALNTRELEILHLMSKGLSNNQIALRLNLALEAVKWYNKHIFSKLGVASRSQAVAQAFESGILAEPASPQAKKESRPTDNLPNPITSFIGREKEIQEVIHLLSGARLVTITGSGGVGKTRLAIRVAAIMSPQFRDGVRWVGLAALFDAVAFQKRERTQTTNELIPTTGHRMGEELVMQAVAKSLRIPDMPELPLIQGVLDHLRGKKLLLVLDNCEHLIEACASFVEYLLSHCPTVTVLATSREALIVPGEKAWRLPSLALTPGTPVPGDKQAEEHHTDYPTEAVTLFLERAADVLPGYHPGASDGSLIAHICQRLDGIPLAIELAAARMNLLSLQEIATRLDQRFNLLTSGHRTALPRHQTLRAAIEWSYDLLSPAEQVLFRRLTIFAGSFTLEAAEAICTSHELPGVEVLTLLGRLVDKSLLNVEPTPQPTDLATRYRFLDTIRSFGRLKLEEAGEMQLMHKRHAEYYVRLVEAVGPELLLRNQVRWYRLLYEESDNLRAVVDWGAESNQAESGLRVLGALLWFLWSHGSTLEGLDLVLKTLALPSAQPPTIFRARALNTAGYLHWVLGDLNAATQKIEEALSILRQADDEANMAWSLQLLGMVLTSRGDYDRADQAMKEGVAVSKKLGDYHSGVFSLAFQGDIALQQGDRAKARQVYEDSAELLRTFGNLIFLAYPLRRLGYLHLEQHDTDQARDCFRQSLLLNHEVGDKRAVAASLVGLAALSLQLEQPEVAARLYGAVESQLDSLSMNLLPLDQAELSGLHSQLITILDPNIWTDAYTEGRAMNEEQVMNLANEVYRGTGSV